MMLTCVIDLFPDIETTDYIYAFELAFLATRPKPLSPIFNFLKPFAVSTWLGVAVAGAVIAAFAVLSKPLLTSQGKQHLELLSALGVFVGQSEGG